MICLQVRFRIGESVAVFRFRNGSWTRRSAHVALPGQFAELEASLVTNPRLSSLHKPFFTESSGVYAENSGR